MNLERFIGPSFQVAGLQLPVKENLSGRSGILIFRLDELVDKSRIFCCKARTKMIFVHLHRLMIELNWATVLKTEKAIRIYQSCRCFVCHHVDPSKDIGVRVFEDCPVDIKILMFQILFVENIIKSVWFR